MRRLITNLNLTGHDDLYQALIGMHQGLQQDVQDKINAKLILLLANHIGDPAIVREAIVTATRSVQAGEET